ncbi:MAG: aminotransferase class IV [Bacteroidota bacterium]
MINSNGELLPSNTQITANNRGFLYGDALFETFKIVNHKILFFEDHYFRLMASMRIVRMQIPMTFTMEYLEEQILKLIESENYSTSARVRMTVYRNEGGFYAPEDNSVRFIMQAFPLENTLYVVNSVPYEVDLYKDFVVTKQLLSTIKTTNKMINIIGSVYAKENDLQNCLLINNDKNVVEALNGNLFMVWNGKLITPPISDGCLNGIMRKHLIEIVKKSEMIEVVEESISPFDLQKADELFITNVITGIQPITKYRKKEYATDFASQLLAKLNEVVF